jgi:hypothetical protein
LKITTTTYRPRLSRICQRGAERRRSDRDLRMRLTKRLVVLRRSVAAKRRRHRPRLNVKLSMPVRSRRLEPLALNRAALRPQKRAKRDFTL